MLRCHCAANLRLCFRIEQVFSWHNLLQIPAPERGEIVRQMGEALREKKSLLGKMVKLILAAS